MAQLVEHILGKDEVPGPNPGSSSRQPRRETFGALVFYGAPTRHLWEHFSLWGCLELLSYTLDRALCQRRRIGPHTPSEVLQACMQGKARGYLRRKRIPGQLQTFSLRLGHPRGKTVINCFLTPSGRCATPKGNLRGFGFLWGSHKTFVGAFFFMGLSGVAILYFGSGSVPKAQNRSAYPERSSASLHARQSERVSSPKANTRAAPDILAGAQF